MERLLQTPLYYDGNVITYNGISIIFNAAIDISVSSNFFYPEYCVVYRGGGTANSLGVETFTGVLYGICGYDNNANGNTSFQGKSWQASPVVIVPDTDILFQNGDKVVISLANGRTIEATVRQFETQKEAGIEGTTLWLRGGNDE